MLQCSNNQYQQRSHDQQNRTVLHGLRPPSTLSHPWLIALRHLGTRINLTMPQDAWLRIGMVGNSRSVQVASTRAGHLVHILDRGMTALGAVPLPIDAQAPAGQS